MRKKWSRYWIASKQPRKQRKYRYQAPLHARQRLVSSMLDKKLRKEFNKRSLPIRRGDEVIIMSGSFKGKTGKIARVDLKKLKIFIEGIKRKKVSGQEVDAAIDPSYVKITKLEMDDKKRRKFLARRNK